MIILEMKLIEGRSVTVFKTNGKNITTAFKKMWNIVYEKGLIRNVW